MNIRLLLPMLCLLAGCASNRPVVYSGPAGGDSAAVETAIAECGRLATAAGATPNGGAVGDIAGAAARNAAVGAAGGAVGGAIAGSVARGAGIGAASAAAVTLVQSVLTPQAPNPAYRVFVERCLQDKGFETVGWK